MAITALVIVAVMTMMYVVPMSVLADARNVTLTYDSNGGTTENVVETKTIEDGALHVDVALNIDLTFTHANDADKKVVFLGWTETKTNAIYSAGDTLPVLLADNIHLTGTKTIYAAYGNSRLQVVSVLQSSTSSVLSS